MKQKTLTIRLTLTTDNRTSPYPPIVILSTKNSEKCELVLRHLRKLGLLQGCHYEVFDACRGADLTTQQLSQVDVQRFFITKKAGHEDYLWGEIGGAFNHLKIYEKVVANNWHEALIIEDDVVLNAQFLTLLKNRQQWIPKDTNIVNFHTDCLDYQTIDTVNKQHSLVQYQDSMNGATCYWLSLNAAKQLLNRGYPVRMPADVLLNKFHENQSKAYGIEPQIVDLIPIDSGTACGEKPFEVSVKLRLQRKLYNIYTVYGAKIKRRLHKMS